MLLTRWSPLGQSWFRQMHDLHNEMNRLFNRCGDWNEAANEVATFPALNVWEGEDAFHVEAELPGLDLKSLEMFVANQNQLTIKGERRSARPEKAVQHRQERQFGKFARTLTLPAAVDDAKVEARFENGVLNVNLPKHERAKPRKIAIKA